MSRLLIALLAATAAPWPALAQPAGHGGHQPAAPARQPATDPHAGHAAPAPDPHAGHRAATPAQASEDPHAGHGSPAPPATDPHAGHGAHAPPEPAADPHAGHSAPSSSRPQADPHAGHDQPSPGSDPHAGHRMEGHSPAAPAPPVGPPPPAAFSGPENAADALFGEAGMRAARAEMIRVHGGMATHRFRFDRLELGFGEGEETYAWDADFFYGGPLDRIWIKSEGEGAFGDGFEQGEVQALWSRAISPFFDAQAGLRYDFGPDPDRAHLVLGLQGTAPYWLEVDAAAFLSDEGELTARVEGEYDLRITQRLILQPRMELELSLQDMPELRIGSGLSSAEAGIRLRYQIVPELAPYVGVEYRRAFGDTADFRRAAGEDVGGFRLLAGLRAWF